MYTAWIIYHENNNSLIKEKMRRVIGCKRTDARNGEQKRAIELFFRSSFEPNNPHHLKRANVFFGVISDSKFSLLYLRTITLEQLLRRIRKTVFNDTLVLENPDAAAPLESATRSWTSSKTALDRVAFVQRIARLVSPSTPPPPNRTRPYFFILPRQRPACRPRFAR